MDKAWLWMCSELEVCYLRARVHIMMCSTSEGAEAASPGCQDIYKTKESQYGLCKLGLEVGVLKESVKTTECRDNTLEHDHTPWNSINNRLGTIMVHWLLCQHVNSIPDDIAPSLSLTANLSSVVLSTVPEDTKATSL